MIKGLIFRSIMWVLVKARIADELNMTTCERQFKSYCKKGEYL